jgi:hypothetical protein
MVRRAPIDVGGVHVPAALQTNLTVSVFLVDIRLAGDADRHKLVADGDGNRVLVVAM